MNKKLLLLLSVITMLLGFTAVTYAMQASNPVSINESFNTATTDGTPYKQSGENYAWDAIATGVFGNTKGSVSVNLSTPALSLTDNAGRNFLQFPDGIGGYDRDVNISFNAGVVYGFDQKEVDWYMVFTSTDGSELFRLHFQNGGGEAYKSAFLETGSDSRKTSYTFTNQKFTKLSAYVVFNKNGGGTVTFGNVQGEFAKGTDIASVSAEIKYNQSNKTDWKRPFIIDDVKLETVDKANTTVTVQSDRAGTDTAGARVVIDGVEYTAGEDGAVSEYFTLGSHSYTASLRHHETKSGTFTVSETGTEYSFTDITANAPVLIRAYYNNDGSFKELKAEAVTPENGKYTVFSQSENGDREKCFLWESLASVKPAGKCSITEHGNTNDVQLTLNYADNVTPQSISLSGDSYVYLPSEGDSSTNAFTATVLDNIGYEIDDCDIDWSLPNETSDKIGIENGIVTVKAGYERVTNDNGCDVTVRAAVRDTSIYADKTLHIRNVQRPISLSLSGPNVIKDGTAAEFQAADVKNQYNDTFTGEAEYTLTSTDVNAEIDDLTITPHTGEDETTEITVTITVPSGEGTVAASKRVTIYGYDFYEPGTVSPSYGNPRMAEVGGVNSIVWPASGTGRKVEEIPFPEKVKLTPGTKKVVTFDNICTSIVGFQERSLQLVSSKDIAIVDIDFGGGSKNGEVYTDWTAAQPYYGTVIGEYELNKKASARFELITDHRGITTASLSYNGSTPTEYNLGLAEDISLIRLEGSTGAPDDRYLTLTNIKITDDSDNLDPVRITGDDKIAVVFGATARKQFTSHIYKSAEGEQFEWSVTDEDGGKINGVSITNDGVLSVRDDVEPQTAILTYSSTTDPDKKAQHTVEITEYAEVSDFELNGPLYLDVNSTATYSVSHITDEYGDEADMQRGFTIASGDNIATIDKTTGVVTLNEDATGEFVITAAVGNPGKVTYRDIAVYVGRYSVTGGKDDTDVDVTELSHYSEDRKYLVTTATADGELVNQTEQVAQDGHIEVNMTGADKYEVSPIYSYTDVGDIADGFTIPICDGTYSFSFKKPDSERVIRGDIYVNGKIVGSNVDQFGEQRTTHGALYTVNDIKITGGKAVVMMKDNTSVMDSITVTKTPSILTRKPHVYLLGDSLVSAYYGDYNYSDSDGKPLYGTGQTGWGETLGMFLGDDLCITNLAESGSGAAILYDTTFPTVMANAEPGDYVLLEAGYQDEANGGEELMKIALNGMAGECAEKGIELILITPNCSAHGTSNKPEIRFGPEVLQIAQAHNLLGINLSGAEYPLLERLGETYWADNFSLTDPDTGAYIDKLHSSYFGAVLHAKYIAEAIYAAKQDSAFADRLSTFAINTDYEYTAADSEGNIKTIKINQGY